MSQLNGKIALVTGGNSGIGLAIAQRFVAEGAEVFIVGRRQAALAQAVARIGGKVRAIQADVTSQADLARIVTGIQESHGRLDILVTSSGRADYATLADTTELHYDQTFDLNTRAAAFTVQAALPLMGQGATVVLIGSIAGVIGTTGYGAYGASKAALRAFARTWTGELAQRGIRVNALSPGPIDTAMFDDVSDEVRSALTARIPLGRLGKAEEVAAAALFLASDQSSFVAGAELCIDGGMVQV
ncbi:SDR family NAD(P)-dependent oxidoreductase [Massilia sp. CMS3.1]|uniref:SDR family NAD(P)-dependent oxidoreductase n=1 Tax=Massilia sp. CMS3.1 TaxID=3373083 RepID=UPI003EE7E409